MKLFISYTQADLAWAEWIAWQLEETGHDVILDRWDFAPGSNFVLRMHEATAEAEKTLAILSPSYLEAAYPQPEWAAAFLQDPRAREQKLIPIRVSPCDLSGLLAATVYLDLAGMDESSATRALRGVLAENRRKPQEKPLYPGTLKKAPSYPGIPREIPVPQYANEEVQKLSSELEMAYRQKEELACAGKNTSLVQKKVLDLRRQIRDGGQLKAGDFLDDGRFRLIQAVGRGGFATVWKSWDRVSHDLVALKVLHVDLAHDRSRRERFFRGARKMAELQYKGIVRVVKDRIEEGGYFAFAMEYVPGGDLRDFILNSSCSHKEIIEIILKIGRSLHFAHKRGVIHRDVKPANILMDPFAGPKLTDFDLVRALDTTGGTRAGTLGTFVYASPEAMEKPQEVRDVYSLGMTAVFAFHGADLPPNIIRNTKEFIEQLRLSYTLETLLVKAVELRAGDRFQSIEEFGKALLASLDPRAEGQSTIDPANKFETFIVETSNYVAYSAAKAVAENKEQNHNPLFICAGSGFGKSHLLQAIVNHVREKDPGRRVRFTTAKDFVNEFILSLRYDRTKTFRERCRKVDLLLIDDIYFFKNKQRSQDELYHTFNALHSSGTQIVVSSSLFPKAMARFDSKVLDYLTGGLVVDISPPGLEIKLAMLNQKCRSKGIDLPGDVAMFIAKSSDSNIPEILGYLNRLIASAKQKNAVITLEFAREALKAVLPEGPNSKTIKPSEIVSAACTYFGLTHAEIKSRSNTKRVALPRQVAMYLCKRRTDLSFPEIGSLFGKHHSTVMHSIDKIGQLRLSDTSIAEALKTIEDQLEAYREAI